MTSPSKTSLRAALAVLFLGILPACGRFEAPYMDVDLASKMGDECSYIKNSKGQRVSWRGRTPVTFFFAENFPENFKTGVQKAIADWADATGISLIQLSDSPATTSEPRGDKLNVIYWIQSGANFTSSEQAKTTARWTRDQLIDTDIMINANSWLFYLDALPELGGYLHLESLMVHEFGHALGLIHQNMIKSVMYPYLSTDLVRNAPQPDSDVQNIHCVYQ